MTTSRAVMLTPQHGVSKPNAYGLPHTEELLALRLSDTQLDEIMRLCQPLALHCRDALLRILAHELRGRRDVGDGELHRLARTIIRDNRLFDPPAEYPDGRPLQMYRQRLLHQRAIGVGDGRGRIGPAQITRGLLPPLLRRKRWLDLLWV
jgi:hypothetical protein